MSARRRHALAPPSAGRGHSLDWSSTPTSACITGASSCDPGSSPYPGPTTASGLAGMQCCRVAGSSLAPTNRRDLVSLETARLVPLRVSNHVAFWRRSAIPGRRPFMPFADCAVREFIFQKPILKAMHIVCTDLSLNPAASAPATMLRIAGRWEAHPCPSFLSRASRRRSKSSPAW